MDQKLIARIRAQQRVYIHNVLDGAVFYFKTRVDDRSAKGDRDGIGLEIISCLVFMAFSVEARFNFLGFKLVDGWDEQKAYMKKIKKVVKALKVHADYNARPYVTLGDLYIFRNTLAHGKPLQIREEKELIGTYNELQRGRNNLKPEWEKNVTEQFVSRCYEDTEAIWTSLLASSGLTILDTVTQGESTLEIIGEVI
jgi:hypothetical protein